MTNLDEMYTTLFNHITDIQKDLQIVIDKAKKVQIDVEEMYINKENLS